MEVKLINLADWIGIDIGVALRVKINKKYKTKFICLLKLYFLCFRVFQTFNFLILTKFYIINIFSCWWLIRMSNLISNYTSKLTNNNFICTWKFLKNDLIYSKSHEKLYSIYFFIPIIIREMYCIFFYIVANFV